MEIYMYIKKNRNIVEMRKRKEKNNEDIKFTDTIIFCINGINMKW